MRVSFTWVTPTDQLIPEEASLDHLAELRDLQTNQRWQEGLLELTGEHPTDTARLSDPLGNLIQQVCIDSIPILQTDGEVDIAFHGSPAQVKMKAEGNIVVLSGDVVPTLRFARAELLSALVDCAVRYVAVMRRIHEGNERWGKYFDRFDVLIAEAREALTGKGERKT